MTEDKKRLAILDLSIKKVYIRTEDSGAKEIIFDTIKLSFGEADNEDKDKGITSV